MFWKKCARFLIGVSIIFQVFLWVLAIDVYTPPYSENYGWAVMGLIFYGFVGSLFSIPLAVLSANFLRGKISRISAWEKTIAGTVFYSCGAVIPVISLIAVLVESREIWPIWLFTA